MTEATDKAAPAQHPAAPMTAGYRGYALGLLMVIYTLNMLDRQIVTILAEPLKQSLGLADWQIGAVTGLAFAVFYTALGLPMARLADRSDRALIIAGSLAVWSGFTVACGYVRNFPQLLIARVGVGVGEAGCTPAAHSLIAEMTPKAKLASALAFYSLGIPLGSLIGLAMGGIVADALGWRAAFVAAGVPGLAVAAVALFTLCEPRRAPARSAEPEAAAPLKAALAELRGKPAFWWISLAAGLAAFGYYSQAAFYGSLFMRAHPAEIAELGTRFGLGPGGFLGLALGLILGGSSALGTFLGGKWADRAAQKDIRGYARVPLWGLLGSAPFFVALDLAPSAALALACLTPAIFFHALTYGPTFASVQSLASPRVRATAAAILLFLTNLIGLGLGPIAVGALSDYLAATAGPALGLQLAMAWSTVLVILAAGCFYLAGRTIEKDQHTAG